ncbi:MAG: hypothetical protein QOC57_538 [Ilumatobacteraceae bacterium]
MVDVVVVSAAAADVGGGGAGCVGVGAAAVDGLVGADCVEPAEQPTARPHTTSTDQRVVVRRPLLADLRLRSVKHFGRRSMGVSMIALTMVAVGCNVDARSTTPDTLAPLGTPSNTAPPTTATTLPATTDLPVVAATSTSALPAGACVFSAPLGTPEVTFEVGTRLYSLNPNDGTTTCLTELTLDNVGPLQWSPAGDRVLLNSVTVFDGTQALPSGYLSTNSRVSWSYPTGKALIAPAVADNHLLWRTAGQPLTRTDISFLERTDVAAYHPAGRNIFAAGQAADGTAGLFIASNRGENPRLIARLDTPTTAITEIAPDASGTRVYFVHDHHDGTFHVHSLDLQGLALIDVTDAPEPIARLTTEPVVNGPVAWRIGDCAALTRTQTVAGDQPGVFATLSTEPVGFIDSNHLVLSVRNTGCTGPSDLWMWNIATSAATPLIAGVDQAAIRSVLTSFGELPGDINQAAPG